MRCPKVLLIMLMALLACCGYAGIAAAAGPSSVLLVTPASGRTASLYASDGDYGRLRELLDGAGAAERAERPPLEAAMRARQLTVTWLVDDVEPWRLQQVYVPQDGGAVWVHTAADVPRTYEGGWHRARQPQRLTALLKKLGLLAPSHRTEAGGGESPAPPAFTVSGWWWALPGAAAGAAGAVLYLRWRERRAYTRDRQGGQDPPGPHRQLIDL
ncbi:hypothetical protein [Streptomyces sp. NPDC048442]|uniref:hypothetical protein n=1 Tax=Streptomyces sp. NPDC048442 TaxID=3154823 RepID=UPI003421F368